MKHLGDITKIDGHEVPLVDIVCGGSPCQDLSIAGRRAGLDGERSGLFMEQIRIVKEMRDESTKQLRSRRTTFDIRSIQPRYMVWENVPGAFSSNKGEDFRCVLEEICRIKDKTATVPMPEKGRWSNSGCIVGDGWSVAWRVHDAQFWGVPQRRKRIALVADFGSESASEILFERKGLYGNIEKGGDAVQRIATDTKIGINKAISFQERSGKPGGGKGILIQNERTGALSTLNNQSVCIGNGQLHDALSPSEEVSKTLNCMDDPMKIITYGIFTSIVRRLTPLECERLQGYPDHWTDIGEWTDSKGKKHKDADSPRYKALGNSIALPFWEWMANRICNQYDRSTTMASLFDGIGGFPLVFSRCGCRPVWASEIEEFPIAVTKIRFPEDE